MSDVNSINQPQTEINTEPTSSHKSPGAPLTEEVFFKYFNGLNEFLASKFDQIDEKFEELDAKFTTKFEELDTKFTAKFEQMDNRFANIEARLDFIQKDIADIRTKLDELSIRTREDTDVLGVDIIALKRRVEKLEKLFTELKAPTTA